MRLTCLILASGAVALIGGCLPSSSSKPPASAATGGASGGNGGRGTGGSGASDASGPLGGSSPSDAAGSGGAGDTGGSSGAGGANDAGGQAGAISVAVTPAAAHTPPGGTVQFSATVSGNADTSVVWSVMEGASGGSISSSGLYTSPTTAGSYHVVATSHADATARGTAVVSVNAVGSCANLPAAGTWQSIGPSAVTANGGGTFSKGFSEAIVVDPFDPATVWLGVGYGGFFKSTDCGSTWTHINTGRNGAILDQGSPISMAIDPVDRGTIYVTPIFDSWGFWKSTNGGVDWDQLFAPGSQVTMATNNFSDAIAMDPTDHRHMIVNFHTDCSGAFAPTCEAETKDGGATWRVFKTPNPGWEEGAGAWILGPKTWLYGGLHLYLTEDSAATWTDVTPKGTWSFSGGEVAIHPTPRLPDGTYLLTSNQGIATSSDGRTWNLLPGFPNRTVGFAMGNGNLFASDQWSSSYYMASTSNTQKWSVIPPPKGLPMDQGAPYLDYDAVHHVLYSSNYAGGTWRLVVP